MGKGNDQVSLAILKVVSEAIEPLETKEVQEKIQKVAKKATRSIILHRLSVLRGDQEIRGKFVGPGKGVWIWWKKQEKEAK